MTVICFLAFLFLVLCVLAAFFSGGSGKKFKACCYGKVTTVQQGPSP